MPKHNRQPRRPTPNPTLRNRTLNQRNVHDQDLWLHARSFHTAAKKLAEALESDSGPFIEFAACPVVFMYRHALELHLKAIVLGEGGNFLVTKPDRLSIQKTHSVSWLAQFVVQIVTVLQWEKEFKCEGIENLDGFKAAVQEVNSVDPGSYSVHLPVTTEAQDSAQGQAKSTIRNFAHRMDALLELLNATADALAAEWDMRSEVYEAEWQGGDIKPTIQ